MRFVAGITALLAVPALLQAANWGKDGLWSDGRAEVAVYDAEAMVDGKARAFKEHLITLREEVRVAQKPVRTFKLNQVQNWELENYPQSVLASVVVKEDAVERVVKMTVATQDWNGNTIKSYNGDMEGNGGTLRWDVAGTTEAGSADIAVEREDYFEEQLPLSLRARPFKDGFEKNVRLFDAQTGKTGGAPMVTEATLNVAAGATVRGRVGSIPCWTVTINRKGGKTDTYWFEKKYPNLLIKMETADGRKRMLAGRARWTFWDRRIPRPKVLN